MIISPSAFFARSSVYKGALNFLALNNQVDAIGPVVSRKVLDRASPDGLKWYPFLCGGDYVFAVSTDRPEGCFQPTKVVPFKGKIYIFGNLWRDAATVEGAVYVSVDGCKTINKAVIPIATLGNIGGVAFADVAANNDYLAAVKPGGQLIWTDGTDWFSRTDLPLNASGIRAYVMTATSAGFVIGGANTSSTAIISATTPGGTWGARTHPFGINLVTTAAAGDVALIFSIYGPTNSSVQLISAPLTDLTTWTNRSFVASRYIDFAMHGGGRWFAGSSGEWLTTTTGTSGWADAANKPWGSGSSRPRAGYYRNSKWHVHHGNGGLAISDDGLNWVDQPNSGLASTIYTAAAIAA